MEQIFGCKILDTFPNNDVKIANNNKNSEISHDGSYEVPLIIRKRKSQCEDKSGLKMRLIEEKENVKLIENNVSVGNRLIAVKETNKATLEVKKDLIKEKFQCEFCNKIFKKPWVLKIHIRTHTGEKVIMATYYCYMLQIFDSNFC